LIHRDEINVAYILRLLAKLHAASGSKDKKTRDDADKTKRSIADLLGSETQLRSKRELIRRFIDQNMPTLGKDADVVAAFRDFWTDEKRKSFEQLCKDENLRPEDIGRVIEHYHFSGHPPLQDEIVAAMQSKPKILERKTVIERIIDKVLSSVGTFDDGIGDI